MKKRNINIKYYKKIQELNPENKQSSEFQDVGW